MRIAAVVAGIVACGSPSPFDCADDSQCVSTGVDGVCAAGYCAFPDTQCPSGLRYGALAGDGLAGTCVEPEVAGTSRTSMGAAAAGSAVGSSGQTVSTVGGSGTSTGATDGSSNASTTSACVAYADADGDGFGDPGTTTQRCGPPEGFVDNDDDCDDGDERVYPGGLACPNPPGLVAWFRLDESMGNAHEDSSDNDHTGMAQPGVQPGAAGRFGSAAGFDGTGNIDISDVVATLAPGGAPPDTGTIEAWVRLEDSGSCTGLGCTELVLRIHDTTGDGFGSASEIHLHAIDPMDGLGYRWGFYIRGGISDCVISGPGDAPAQIGTWTHLAGTWAAGTCRLYVDGALVETSAYATVSGPWLGAEIGGVGPRIFNGEIDEIMIFDVERSASQIGDDCGCVGG